MNVQHHQIIPSSVILFTVMRRIEIIHEKVIDRFNCRHKLSAMMGKLPKRPVIKCDTMSSERNINMCVCVIRVPRLKSNTG